MKRKLILLSLAATLATAAAAAYALPQYAITFIFYSDATYTTEVGEGHRDCRNNWHVFWGEKTAYPVAKYQENCPI